MSNANQKLPVSSKKDPLGMDRDGWWGEGWMMLPLIGVYTPWSWAVNSQKLS